MPELAEIALYARDLNELSQTRLLSISFPNRNNWGSTIIPLEIRAELKKLVRKTLSFSSGGKALFVHAGSNPKPIVEFRLGMTGRFHLAAPHGKWLDHCFLRLKFDKTTIYYSDPRRFGRMVLPRSSNLSIGGYSPKRGFWINSDPELPNGFLNSPRISWLLRTGDKTGVGNYMANEALGRLDLSPFDPCRDHREAIRILKMCSKISKQSYLSGGYSFGSGFFTIDGTEGRYGKVSKFYRNRNVPRAVFQNRAVYSRFAS